MNEITAFPSNHAPYAALSLHDIITSDATHIVLTTYNFELPWLLDTFPVLNTIPVFFGHGSQSMASPAAFAGYPSIRPHFPKLPRFGTNHGKILLVFLPDNVVRVCISTSNLVDADYCAKMQMLWAQEFPCYPASHSSSHTLSAESSSVNPFAENSFGWFLYDYVSKLFHPMSERNDQFKHLVLDHLARTDFSDAAVDLVTSVPGTYKKEEMKRYGLMRIKDLLPATDKHSTLWCSCSSIGSLSEPWITNQLSRSFAGSRDMRLIWPTEKTVRTSFFEEEGADHLWLYDRNCKPFLVSRMCEFELYEPNLLSHAKFYTRLGEKSGSSHALEFLCVTSANLSKAAWGEAIQLVDGDQAFRILSFEIGVLFRGPACTFTTSDIPIKVPARPYTAADKPFARITVPRK
jgi:hypothetical protein